MHSHTIHPMPHSMFWIIIALLLAFQCISNRRSPCSIEGVTAYTPFTCDSKRRNRIADRIPEDTVIRCKPYPVSCYPVWHVHGNVCVAPALKSRSGALPAEQHYPPAPHSSANGLCLACAHAQVLGESRDDHDAVLAVTASMASPPDEALGRMEGDWEVLWANFGGKPKKTAPAAPAPAPAAPAPAAPAGPPAGAFVPTLAAISFNALPQVKATTTKQPPNNQQPDNQQRAPSGEGRPYRVARYGVRYEYGVRIRYGIRFSNWGIRWGVRSTLQEASLTGCSA
jgi:hypothetical protein